MYLMRTFKNLYDRLRNKELIITLITILILFVSGIFFVSGLKEVMDIYWADEGYYLYAGRFFFSENFPAWFGKLYSFWYWILHLFESNAVSLYYLNYNLMTILTPAAVFLLLTRGFNVNNIIGALISLTFLISLSNVTVWPKVSHFIIITVSVIILFSIRQKDIELKYLVALIGIYILLFIRPEFILTLFILILSFIYSLIRKRINIKNSLVHLAYFSLFAIALTIWLGIPYSGERSFVAFQQHFAYVDHLRYGGDYYPWSEYDVIMSEKFPGAKSLTEALSVNPSAVLSHISFNLSNYPHYLLEKLTEIVIPKAVISIPYYYRIAIILMMVLIVVFYCLTKNTLTKSSKEIIDNYRKFKFEIFLCAALFLPSFISSILYHPREHYLIIQISLIIIIVSPLVSVFRPIKSFTNSIIFLIVIFALFLTLNPKAKSYIPENDGYIKRTIEYLVNLNSENRITILDKGKRLIYFLPDNFINIDVDTLDGSLNNDLSKIDIIYFTPHVINAPSVKDNSLWKDFIGNYESYGFIEQQLGFGYPLLIRNQLFKE